MLSSSISSCRSKLRRCATSFATLAPASASEMIDTHAKYVELLKWYDWGKKSFNYHTCFWYDLLTVPIYLSFSKGKVLCVSLALLHNNYHFFGLIFITNRPLAKLIGLDSYSCSDSVNYGIIHHPVLQSSSFCVISKVKSDENFPEARTYWCHFIVNFFGWKDNGSWLEDYH